MSASGLSSVTIAEARQQPDGTTVAIAGVVTVASSRFESALLDQGFAIQDSSGGIYVTMADSASLPVGAAVQVTGTLQDDGHGQRVLQPASWFIQESEPTLALPQSVSIRGAAQRQGQLVTVQGIITHDLVDDGPYGDRLWIQDETGTVQVYISRSTQIPIAQLPCLQVGNLLRVTGLSSHYDRSDEVMPRRQEDIRLRC